MSKYQMDSEIRGARNIRANDAARFKAEDSIPLIATGSMHKLDACRTCKGAFLSRKGNVDCDTCQDAEFLALCNL